MYYIIRVSETIMKKPIICLEIFFPEELQKFFNSMFQWG